MVEGAVYLTLLLTMTMTWAVQSEHPHARLTTAELTRVRGYPSEVHRVITKDGYVLQLHRIPHGRILPAGRPPPQRSYSRNSTSYGDWSHSNSSNSSRNPRVVFILHGFLCSSADYVMNDPDQALGFLLADAGYDVWLGNIRGNFYGRRHIHLSPKSFRFWDYSANEISRFDLPAMLAYVRRVSGASQVSYVGHSMGNSLLWATLHHYPYINSWIRVNAAMAPAAYIYHKEAPIGVLSSFFDKIEREMRRRGIVEMLGMTPDRVKKASVICGPNSFSSVICTVIHFLIGGPNNNYVDREYLPVIFAHTPAGTGLRVFTHLLQLHHSKRFQAFDYGVARNLEEYGMTTPPLLSLSRVTIPVGLFWAENDWIVNPRDVLQTASELPKVVLNYKVPLRDFNHLDFMWAENAHYLVYRPLINFLEHFQ